MVFRKAAVKSVKIPVSGALKCSAVNALWTMQGAWRVVVLVYGNAGAQD